MPSTHRAIDVGGDLHRVSTPGRAILVAGVAPLLEALAMSFAGWSVEAVSAGQAEIIVTREGQGFRLSTPDRPEPLVVTQDAAQAAYELTSKLLKWYCAEQQQRLLLHAAAVSVRGGQLLLVGESEAGKSTLSLQLLTLGHRLFGDDLVALELTTPPRATALGLLPKVRLPLPPTSGDALQSLVASVPQHRFPTHLQLCLDQEALALPGEREPTVGLLLLRRRESERAVRLTALSSGAALKVLLHSYIAPHLTSDQVVRGMTTALSGLPLWCLDYGDSRQAASFLHLRFGRPL